MAGMMIEGAKLASSSSMGANMKVLKLGSLMKSKDRGLTFRLNTASIAFWMAGVLLKLFCG